MLITHDFGNKTTINFKVKEKDKELLKQGAEHQGLNVSQFIRYNILNLTREILNDNKGDSS